jgi:uncharacterized protein YceH (UPF0502 family)
MDKLIEEMKKPVDFGAALGVAMKRDHQEQAMREKEARDPIRMASRILQLEHEVAYLRRRIDGIKL